MKALPIIALAVAGGLALSGCATSGGNSQFLTAITEIAKDPKCGHTDRVNVVLGPISTGSVFLERNCPVPASEAKE